VLDLTRSCLRNETGFFDKAIEDDFGVSESGFQPEKSETLLAGLAQLDLTAPFGLEDLGCSDATVGIGVKD